MNAKPIDVWSIVYVMVGLVFALVVYASGVAIVRFTQWLRR